MLAVGRSGGMVSGSRLVWKVECVLAHPPLSLEQDWQEALQCTCNCVNSMPQKLLRLPQWRHQLPPRHHWLGDEDGNCILSVFTLSSQYPLVKEYGETNPSHTMNDANLMHDAPAWVVFLFLACHVYYCSTSIAVMSVIMEFNLLPPDYSSTFWLVKGTFLQCGLWRKYPTPKTLWTFICAMINKWCTSYANQIDLPLPNHRCVHSENCGGIFISFTRSVA